MNVPEGVLEGDLLCTLMEMDTPVNKGDHFALLKRLRLSERRHEMTNMRINAIQQDIHQLIKMQGGEAQERDIDRVKVNIQTKARKDSDSGLVNTPGHSKTSEKKHAFSAVLSAVCNDPSAVNTTATIGIDKTMNWADFAKLGRRTIQHSIRVRVRGRRTTHHSNSTDLKSCSLTFNPRPCPILVS